MVERFSGIQSHVFQYLASGKMLIVKAKTLKLLRIKITNFIIPNTKMQEKTDKKSGFDLRDLTLSHHLFIVSTWNWFQIYEVKSRI